MGKVTFVTPLLVDNNAQPTMEVYVRVVKELHDQLLAAGLVAAPDTGQLNFTDLAALTLTASQTYGYRLYRLNDGNALPVYLKLRFRSPSSLSGIRVPISLGVSVGVGTTDGAGNLARSTPEYSLGAPLGSSLTQDMSTVGIALPSLICCKPGFIGVSWKQRVLIANASTGPSSQDAVALANFFVCRDTDNRGELLDTGVSLFVVAPGGISPGSFGAAPIVTHLAASGVFLASSRAGMAFGSDVVSSVGGKRPLFNIYTMTPEPKRLAQLLLAVKPNAVDNDEFESTSVGTQTRRFIAMNTCWPADPFTGTEVRTAIAMLWED